MQKLGLIAGNGRFPFLLLDAARAHNLTVVVAAINEETDPEIDARAAADPNIHVHWLSLGELSRLIETFKAEGVTRAVMAGQVKHKQIFSSIRPDWRLAKLLLNLRTRSTAMLLGAIAKVLGDEGIELISSTQYLEPLLAKPGVLTQRVPDEEEEKEEGLTAVLYPHRRIKISSLVKAGGSQPSTVQLEHIESSTPSDQEQLPTPPPSPQATDSELVVDNAERHPGASAPGAVVFKCQLTACFSASPDFLPPGL